MEKIERNKEAEVPAAVEPDPFPAATKSETTGSGSAWVTEPPKVVETLQGSSSADNSLLAPVATTVDPPLATPSSQAVASEPVTAGMRPATVQPSVKIETPPVKTEPVEKPRRSVVSSEKDKKRRERTVRVRERDTESDVVVRRESGRKPVIAERVDDDDPRTRRAVVGEPRRGREVIIEEPRRSADFFSILFGGGN